jgi:hypothetical protein
MDDFTIHPLVGVDVVRILEIMQSSRPPLIPQISPGGNVESHIASIEPPYSTSPDEFPCHDDYFDAPEDQIHYVPSLDHDAVEIFDPYSAEIPPNVHIMSPILEDQHMLRCNCLGIFYLKSLSPDCLGLLQRFPVGHFKPAA